jgi:hypothetical protein
MLQEQVVGCQIVVLPCLDLLLLSFRDLGWVFDSGHGYGSLKEGPAVGCLHCFLELHNEYCPVRAIRFEVRDIRGKLLNGGWRGGGSGSRHVFRLFKVRSS